MDSLGIFKALHRSLCCCLSLGLLILMTGCGKRSPHSVEHAEVSGKVLFAGKPLPGGRISFTSVDGSFASTAIIDEEGNYKMSAPVGTVKIGVDNTMIMMAGKGGPPKGSKKPRPPGMEAEERPVKGRFVAIPAQFKSPDSSGLTYTVVPGSQTHNVELSNSPGSQPGGPGS